MSLFETGVRFAVLGPVRAWHGERELDLGSPQQQAVLAALLLRRGRPATLGDLIDAVWGEEFPPAAVSVLRTYVSRLRKALEPGRKAGQPSQLIVSVGDGYAIRISDDALDLGVFEQRVAKAKKLRGDGDTVGAARLLDSALGEWQGAPLTAIPGPLAESERCWLEEERLTTLEMRVELDIELGRHADVVRELMILSRKHPLRERLSLLLILALFRSGRQAEALEAYRTAREALIRELGIEPCMELQDLHSRILAAGEPSIRASSGSDDSGPADTSGRQEVQAAQLPQPAQLPADLAHFVNREAELERLRSLLPDGDEPTSTVVISAIGGMAGIGKTTLAVHWAHKIADRFPDGQLFVNLRGFDPSGQPAKADETLRSFFDALGVPPIRIPMGLQAQSALFRSLLAKRRMLILLDNARDTDQVRPLLPGAPGCLVIVTSRNQLTGLVIGEGAHPLMLDQLSFPEAYELLARRLGAARLASEPRAVEDIITRCARLPLALAIVAARAASSNGFPLSAVAEEVGDAHYGLDVFANDDDVATDVRAVFSWSYKALSAQAARLFRLLGLHSGLDISIPAASALAGLPLRETRELVGELTRCHLLTEHVPGRYSLHDLLRDYAAERVDAEEAPEERDRAIDRILGWYVHTAAATSLHLTPRRPPVPLEPLPEACRPLQFTTYEQALHWCETERADLIAAVHQATTTGRNTLAWRLAAVLSGFFCLRSHLPGWRATALSGLTAARAVEDLTAEARSQMNVAIALRLSDRVGEAIEHLLAALALVRQLDDIEGIASVLCNLGDAYLYVGDLDKAAEYSLESLELHREAGNSWGYGIALCNLGDIYQRLGRFSEAMARLEEALAVLRADENRWVEGVTLDVLGTVHQRLRQYENGADHYQRALQAHRDVGNRWGEGNTLGNLGDLHAAAGRLDDARTSWQRALAIFVEFDHPDAEKIREKLGRISLDASHASTAAHASISND
ncbi:AfsR/SARP family transcriptional regulator [Streptomyces sp. 049-1]|uniref:AfsR/SARP family transcriptional regulator n=1 Tax=Streptomyces sp. 049-1 TaxID=2789264 RepID=UPI00397FACA6